MLPRRRLFVVMLLIASLLGLAVAFHGLAGSRTAEPKGQAQPMRPVGKGTYERIVSLAPSITECLFALGLGDRVVGVTSFCDHPPEALTRSKVGGYYDLNYEAVVALRPDLVVCLPEHAECIGDLERLGLSHLTVDHRRVEAILESLTTLGQVCGVPDRARALVEEIRQRMALVQARVVDENRPRVLVCVGRNMGSPTIDDVYVAGCRGFYDEMITSAGGSNAYEGDLAFPVVTAEGLLRLQPEIIIDMVADLAETGLTEAEVLRQWEGFTDLPAVQEGRVFLFTEDFVVVPGPRFVQILEKMAAVIHPEGVK